MSNDIVARNLEPELDKADAEVRDHEIPDVPEPEQVPEGDNLEENLEELDKQDLDLDLDSDDSDGRDDGSDEDFDPGVPDSPGTNTMIREVILRDMKAKKNGI